MQFPPISQHSYFAWRGEVSKVFFFLMKTKLLDAQTEYVLTTKGQFAAAFPLPNTRPTLSICFASNARPLRDIH